MRPRSNRGKEVVFTAKASSVPRERGEEDEREEEFESRTAEKPVKEVQVVAHSSFRISVYYTPAGKKGEPKDGRLRHDDFYLLFELRSPREYGEISLFCHVCTCSCIVHADSKISFESCVTDACYTKNWSIQNKVAFPSLSPQSSLPVHLVLACGASSLTYPSDLLSALPSQELLSLQRLLRRQIPEIAYSLQVPPNTDISIPVEYRAKTRQPRYANFIDLIVLDANPVAVLRCDVPPLPPSHADPRRRPAARRRTHRRTFPPRHRCHQRGPKLPPRTGRRRWGKPPGGPSPQHQKLPYRCLVELRQWRRKCGSGARGREVSGECVCVAAGFGAALGGGNSADFACRE